MLCQFTIKNYKCFFDEVTLDMQATNIKEHEKTVKVDIDGERFLPLSVIYGPNGAGKSTILEALYSLALKIMLPISTVSNDNKKSLRISDGFSIVPFKFTKEKISTPTEFELFFRTKTYEYQYNLAVNKKKVVREQLARKELQGHRYSTVFIRNKSKIEMKGSIKKYEVDSLSDELTLLSFLGITHRRNAIIKDIIDWFDNKFDFINYGNPLRDASIAVANEEKFKQRILEMLNEMDIDVSDYKIASREKNDEIEIFTYHEIAEKKYELELSEESNGTIKIFGLLPFIANSIINGTTLVIDELDAKLHPKLLEYVIKLYSDPDINRNGGQLLFTSQDLSTMNSVIFRRDEIWFVAKGESQSSKLYSLVDFKKDNGMQPRSDEMYAKQYLEGRYGADPYLRKIIDWEV